MTKSAIGASVLILLCLAMTGITMVQGQTTVGVSQGDVFEYDMVSYWSSLYYDTVPEELLELNQTEWLRATVTGVSGSQISTRVTAHFRNGTEISSDGSCNIDTGENPGGPPFISANLGKNDLVNPSASEKWYINETVTRTYKDGSRQTNHLRLEYVENSTDVGEYNRIYEYYFDKNTGALVEYKYEFSYTGLTSIQQSKLISSSVWVIPEFPAFIILPLFAMITLFAVAARKRLFHRLP